MIYGSADADTYLWYATGEDCELYSESKVALKPLAQKIRLWYTWEIFGNSIEIAALTQMRIAGLDVDKGTH